MSEPVMYAVVLGTLLLIRVVVSLQSRLARPTAKALSERRA
ncbi:MAG: hypothetical protein ACHQ9S_23015 [Candidatus Binatia bacterium]